MSNSMLSAEALAALSVSDCAESVRGSPPASAVGGDPMNVRALIRIRPFNSVEEQLCRATGDGSIKSVLFVDGENVTVVDPNEGKAIEAFAFDKVFWSVPESQVSDIGIACASQEDVDAFVGLPTVEAVLSGRNSCVFAYGQTGSGKTHTMLGYPGDPGLIPRIVQRLFALVAESPPHLEHAVSASFMEIYNEKVRDLLDAAASKSSSAFCDRKVRFSPATGAYVDGLRRTQITTTAESDAVLVAGTNYRTTASTKMNDTSSRSHAILQLQVRKSDKISGLSRFAVLNLVDLAGSERIRASAVEGAQLKEAKNINLSLTTLRRVIDALIDNASKPGRTKGSLVPYRESMLTWVLSDSLGGNCQTTMLGMMSPHERSLDDTLRTLRYCLRARAITCVVRVNEEKSKVVVGALKAEMDAMRKAQEAFNERSRLEAEQMVRKAAEEEEAKQRAIQAKRAQSVASARVQATLAKQTAYLRKLQDQLDAKALVHEESQKIDAERHAMDDLTEEHSVNLAFEMERIRAAEESLREAEEAIRLHQQEMELLAQKEEDAKVEKEVETKKELANVFRMAARFGRDRNMMKCLEDENNGLRAQCDAWEEFIQRVCRRRRAAKDVTLLLQHHFDEATERERQLQVEASACTSSKTIRLQDLKITIDAEERHIHEVRGTLNQVTSEIEVRYSDLDSCFARSRAAVAVNAHRHNVAKRNLGSIDAELQGAHWLASASSILLSGAQKALNVAQVYVVQLQSRLHDLALEESNLRSDIDALTNETAQIDAQLVRVRDEIPEAARQRHQRAAFASGIGRGHAELTRFVEAQSVVVQATPEVKLLTSKPPVSGYNSNNDRSASGVSPW